MHLRKILDIDNQFFTNSDLIVFLKWDFSAVSYLSSSLTCIILAAIHCTFSVASSKAIATSSCQHHPHERPEKDKILPELTESTE